MIFKIHWQNMLQNTNSDSLQNIRFAQKSGYIGPRGSYYGTHMSTKDFATLETITSPEKNYILSSLY